jgi:hypothetical protein
MKENDMTATQTTQNYIATIQDYVKLEGYSTTVTYLNKAEDVLTIADTAEQDDMITTVRVTDVEGGSFKITRMTSNRVIHQEAALSNVNLLLVARIALRLAYYS